MSMVVENKIKYYEESGICKLLIEQFYVKGEDSSSVVKRGGTYTYIIPIEFIDEVKQYEWQVIPSGFNVTPIITEDDYEQKKKSLGSTERIKALSLNHITPFVRETKTGRYYISSKNDMTRHDNDRNLYVASYKDKAIDLFMQEIERALGEDM